MQRDQTAGFPDEPSIGVSFVAFRISRWDGFFVDLRRQSRRASVDATHKREPTCYV
jgi:hypothetical protein